jgi:hypothetical protein
MEEPIMANERIPNDPYRANPADDPYLSNRDDEYRRAARLDNELQPDPELAEGPASGGRVAMFAVAVALILGAVFYGLNSSSTNPTGTSTAQNTQSTPPAAPPGMRDVTPRANNMEPGTTTGAAPAQPQMPPSSAPTGQDVNRTGNPPMGAAPK